MDAFKCLGALLEGYLPKEVSETALKNPKQFFFFFILMMTPLEKRLVIVELDSLPLVLYR